MSTKWVKADKMRYMRKLFLAVVISSGCCLLFASRASSASFAGLGDLPGGGGSEISTGDLSFESEAAGVSPNGNIVVGKSISDTGPPNGNSEAFRWTSGSGMTARGGLPSSVYYSISTGVSNNDMAVGYADSPAFGYSDFVGLWPDAVSPAIELPMRSDTNQHRTSYTGGQPISGDGRLVVGILAEFPFYNSYEATVWVNAGTPLKLGWLGPGPMVPPPNSGATPGWPYHGYKDYSFANGVNTPGTYIVGGSNSGFAADVADPKYTPQQAVLWHDTTAQWTTAPAAQGLGQIGGYGVGTGSSANDITNNGQKFVGSGCSTNNCGATPTGVSQAFIGTVGNTNLTALGVLPKNDPSVVQSSTATAIAGDGTTVIGFSTTDVAILQTDGDPIPITAHTAFIWDPVLTGGTMMSLKDYLVNSQGLGALLTGWKLKEATGISDDGKVIVGNGVNPQGNYEAFRVTIDVSASLPGDYNHDGKVDAGDYVIWRKTDGTAGGYSLWRTNYGKPPGSGASFSPVSSIPEPASIVLTLLVLASLPLTRGRQRSS